MAYRINKAFGLNTTLSKLIDEITFTVNDIDRRLQEAEKKKAETVVKTVNKAPVLPEIVGTGAQIVIPINAMVSIQGEVKDGDDRPLYLIHELHVPGNILDVLKRIIRSEEKFKAVCSMHLFITDMREDIYSPALDWGYHMIMNLYTYADFEGNDDPLIIFNSMFCFDTDIPPFMVYLRFSTRGLSRTNLVTYPVFPGQKYDEYFGALNHLPVIADLPNIEVT